MENPPVISEIELQNSPQVHPQNFEQDPIMTHNEYVESTSPKKVFKKFCKYFLIINAFLCCAPICCYFLFVICAAGMGIFRRRHRGYKNWPDCPMDYEMIYLGCVKQSELDALNMETNFVGESLRPRNCFEMITFEEDIYEESSHPPPTEPVPHDLMIKKNHGQKIRRFRPEEKIEMEPPLDYNYINYFSISETSKCYKNGMLYSNMSEDYYDQLSSLIVDNSFCNAQCNNVNMMGGNNDGIENDEMGMCGSMDGSYVSLYEIVQIMCAFAE